MKSKPNFSRHRAVAILAFMAAVVGLSTPLSAQPPSPPGREVIDGHEAAKGEVIINFVDAPTEELLAFLQANADADEMKRISKLVPRQLWKMRSRSWDIRSLREYLALFPEIAYAEPNYIVQASATGTDKLFAQQWSLQNTGQIVNSQPAGIAGVDIGAVNAWAYSKGSTANVVAVLDSGVYYSHSDLAINVWSAPASYTLTLNGVTVTCASGTKGFNALTNACTPLDDFGHGTHVAGLIAAVGNNAAGVAGVNQVARLLPIKVLDATGAGTIAAAVEGIEYAIQLKTYFAATKGANVRVINASWGASAYSQALLDEIQKASAADILFVASAGNSGSFNDVVPYYPANYAAPNIVSVAATDSWDYLAGYSNYGGSTVNLAAPGDNIISTGLNGTFVYQSGTSQAAALVSGTAALVLSSCTTLDTAALRANLLNNVTPLGALDGLVATGGRLSAYAAIRACAPPPKPAKPTGLKAVGGVQQVALTWTASPLATSYNVKRAASKSGPWTTVGTTSEPSFTVTGLTNGTTAYFVVSAVNAGGESANSIYAYAKPLAPPTAPVLYKIVPGTAQIYLAWYAATGATGYYVNRADISGGPYTRIASTTSRAYYNKLLTAGSSYCYVVTAYNVNKTEGPPSNEMCGVVK